MSSARALSVSWNDGARTGAPARPQDHGSRDSQGSARRRARKKTELAAAFIFLSLVPFSMIALSYTLAFALSFFIYLFILLSNSLILYRKAGDDELWR